MYGHYGQGNVNVRTSPATMRLKPNTEYSMEFDTLGGGNVYVVSESDSSDQCLSGSFSKGHSTFEFATGEKTDYIVRIVNGSVLDDFIVKETKTTEEGMDVAAQLRVLVEYAKSIQQTEDYRDMVPVAREALEAAVEAAELDTLSAEAAASADVNGDGAVDTGDAVQILQFAAEKITAF